MTNHQFDTMGVCLNCGRHRDSPAGQHPCEYAYLRHETDESVLRKRAEDAEGALAAMAREREPKGWHCSCGWPNGINLAVCAQCGRSPGPPENPCTIIYDALLAERQPELNIVDPQSERGQQMIRNAAYERPTTQGDPPPEDDTDD